MLKFFRRKPKMTEPVNAAESTVRPFVHLAMLHAFRLEHADYSSLRGAGGGLGGGGGVGAGRTGAVGGGGGAAASAWRCERGLISPDSSPGSNTPPVE